MLTLFHGSRNQFESFEINEQHLTREKTMLAEGMGIHLTEDRGLAESYGPYLYTVEVREERVTDFANEENIKKAIENVSAATGVDIEGHVPMDEMIGGVLSGDISAVSLYEEINMHLENNEEFYQHHQEEFTFEEDCLTQKIKKAFQDELQDIVRYYDKSFEQTIYICIKNERNLTIIKRENTLNE